MRVIGWIVTIFFGLVFLGYLFGGRDDPRRVRWVADCAEQRAVLKDVLASWSDLGVIRSVTAMDGDVLVTVEDDRWRHAPHDGKVSIGVAAYCQVVRSDGRGSAFMRGYRSGDIVASVIDGNYTD